MTVLKELMKTIEDRKKNPKKGSYTCSLYDGGVSKIGEKIMEEAEEVVRAAKSEGRDRVIYEVGDLLYHVFVLLGYEGIKLEEIEKELKRRMK
jgi:phosphoribosyl-ATP pyrophosphohydrolase